jgi:ATP-dependent DNA helicase DinG
MQAVLGPRGLLARAIAGYEHRPQQLQMAHLIRRALDERRYALIEAGTGTGKTLAYLLPAALAGRRVVISTATKTLQEQIVYKDIPLLRDAASLDLAVTVMKGRANYLCRARMEHAEADPRFSVASRRELGALETIKTWARSTETGDRAELDLPEGLAVWKDLSATSETCTGKRCPLHEQCFVTRMRRQASESDLIIVNHHLFFADLTLKSSAAGKGVEVIPPYEAVIFDEAHALEDVATEFFGVGTSDWRVSDLVNDAQSALRDDELEALGVEATLARLERLSKGLFQEVAKLVSRGSEQRQRLSPHRARPLAEPAEDLREALLAFKARVAQSEDPDVEALARRAQEIASDLKFLVAVNEPGFVYWAESRARSTLLRAAPINVAEELRERLYRNVDTVIFTSATLAAQGSLDFVKRRLGLCDPESGKDCYSVDSLVLGSPFDYESQAALYLPRDLPDPSDPQFLSKAAEEILSLCALTGGRAFALFTSIKNMSEAHQLLKDRLPCRVLLQGERPKHALIAEFKEHPSVLFAAQSFWEGVDIAGDALSLVIIDKLPFSSPGDPVVAARIDHLKEAGRNAFNEYQLPQAALALRQGFGRLIRSRRDRGIVAVLDRRLTTKTYGRAFLESLPACPRSVERKAIADWWEKKCRLSASVSRGEA